MKMKKDKRKEGEKQTKNKKKKKNGGEDTERASSPPLNPKKGEGRELPLPRGLRFQKNACIEHMTYVLSLRLTVVGAWASHL